MARYFFSSQNGVRHDDDQGTELLDNEAARVHAIKYAGYVMSDEPSVLWDGNEFKFEVSDETGARLFTIVCHAIDEPTSGLR